MRLRAQHSVKSTRRVLPTLDEIRRPRADRGFRAPHAARAANVEDAPAEIWLKLENLQPIGSFKIRGAANAMARRARGSSRAAC